MLELVKEYLRIDFDDEDNTLSLMIEAAKQYITDSIGIFIEDSPKHRLVLLSLVSAMYENRDYAAEKAAEKVQYVLKSIILQEQLKNE